MLRGDYRPNEGPLEGGKQAAGVTETIHAVADGSVLGPPAGTGGVSATEERKGPGTWQLS